MKALEQWQINKIVEEKAAGKTVMLLAAEYNVSPSTIENYIRQAKKLIESESEGYSLKVLLMDGKTKNFDGISHYEKLTSMDVWQLYIGDEVVAIFEARNVAGIISRENEGKNA